MNPQGIIQDVSRVLFSKLFSYYLEIATIERDDSHHQMLGAKTILAL